MLGWVGRGGKIFSLSVKLRDFRPYLAGKIAQMIVISRQIMHLMMLVGLESSDKYLNEKTSTFAIHAKVYVLYVIFPNIFF